MWSRTMGSKPGDDSEGNKGRKEARIYCADLAAGPSLFRRSLQPPMLVLTEQTVGQGQRTAADASSLL